MVVVVGRWSLFVGGRLTKVPKHSCQIVKLYERRFCLEKEQFNLHNDDIFLFLIDNCPKKSILPDKRPKREGK